MLWPWQRWDLCHSWSVKRISSYILSCRISPPLRVLCILSSSVSSVFSVLTNTHVSVRPSLSLLVALSAFVPPSSLLNPATAESHFIPPLVYLPSLSVYLSLAHCLVILSSTLSCSSSLLPVNPTCSLSTVPLTSLSPPSLCTWLWACWNQGAAAA